MNNHRKLKRYINKEYLKCPQLSAAESPTIPVFVPKVLNRRAAHNPDARAVARSITLCSSSSHSHKLFGFIEY